MVYTIENYDLLHPAPVVSVGIITYNQAAYIRSCLDGVLMQEHDLDWEIVIGDDGSTDGTREICLDYQQRHPGLIRLILSDSNRGLMANYLDVARALRGALLAQIAGDDYWTDPLKIMKQVDYFRKHADVGMIYTDFDYYWPDTGRIEKEAFERGVEAKCQDFEDLLLNKRFLAPLTWMVRSQFNPIHFDYADKGYVDEAFAHVLDLYQQTRIHYMPQSTAVKRCIRGSLSNPDSARKMYAYHKGLFEIQKEYSEKYRLSATFKTKLYRENYKLLLDSAVKFKDRSFLKEIYNFSD